MKLLRTLAAAAALATAPSLLAQVAVVVLWVVATLATIAVAPDVFAAWKARPLAWGLTAAFVIGLAATADPFDQTVQKIAVAGQPAMHLPVARHEFAPHCPSLFLSAKSP